MIQGGWGDLEVEHGELGGEGVGVAAAVASAERNVPQSRELPTDHAQRPGACFSYNILKKNVNKESLWYLMRIEVSKLLKLQAQW